MQREALESNRQLLCRAAAYLKCLLLAIMIITVVALLWFPLQRIHASFQINYNEGWNAYKQTLAARGLPLYGEPPGLLTGPTTYPPVSFHLIAVVAHHHDVVMTGRWISLVSFLLTGCLIGLILRALGANAAIAIFAGALYMIGIAILLPDRLGMNDPQLLGEALTTAGLYCYVKSSRSARLLIGAALFFCLAGFTKQNLLAFPAAVAIDLLVRSRKRFALWFAAMIGFAALFTTFALAADGDYFFQHMLFHRGYSMAEAAANLIQYGWAFHCILLLALGWTICRFRSSILLACSFLFANIVAFLLGGGDGVDLNIYFNAFAAAVLVCGFALAQIERVPTSDRRAVLDGYGGALSTLMMVTLFVLVAIPVPGQLRDDRDDAKQLDRASAEFRSAVALVEAAPGPAICEDLLLCYRAGKPYTFDAFVVGDQVEVGRLPQATVLDPLRTERFGSIQLDTLPEELESDSVPIVRNRGRLNAQFTETLLQNYRLTARTPHMLIFLPEYLTSN